MRKCNIIGCGNSLRGFDFNTLEGFNIAVNNAHLYTPYDICVAIDDPTVHLKHIPDNLHTQTKYGIGRGWTMTPQRNIVRSTELIGNWNGSLYASINIALNLGFKELTIYGADNKIGDDNIIHFYEDNPWAQDVVDTYRECFKRFNSFKHLITNQLYPDEKITWITAP